MTSAKQAAANWRNSLLSTGPRTEAGKLISSQNATQHGLTRQTIVRDDHQNEAWSAFHAAMLPDLAPANNLERSLADRIIHDTWLLDRAGAITENLLYNSSYEHRTSPMPSRDTWPEDAALADARAFRADAKTFNLLSLYTQRLERSVHKNLALLKSLQKERTAQPVLTRAAGFQQNAEALQAALQHHAVAARSGSQPLDSAPPPPSNGFVYATALADSAPPPQPAPPALENMAA